ncbi:MAG: type III-B CRISPR module-associated protein Cmr5 [Chloroflexi bacterium]|nr:type III-B CRISPR module-associated protein Cmr5 [Chloroflexota bacterium]
MPRRQTVEQERAKFALGRVHDVKGHHQWMARAYRREVMGLPAMILVNGLGQTLAFLKAKGAGSLNEHAVAYRHLSDWVGKQLSLPGDLLEEITRMDVGRYRLAQAEALAVLTWLKRFAESEIDEERRS